MASPLDSALLPSSSESIVLRERDFSRRVAPFMVRLRSAEVVDTVDTERAKVNFFNLIYGIEKHTGVCPFKEIHDENVSLKGQELLTQSREIIVTRLAGQNRDDNSWQSQITEQACRLYDGINEAWMDYEIRKNKEDARQVSENPPSIIPPEGNSGVVYENDDSKLEVVHQIEYDPRLFTSDTLATPGLLPHVTTSQFFKIAQEGRWHEALPLMRLSKTGPYIVGITKEGSNPNYPHVAFTCRTQSVIQADPEDSLFSRDCFNGPDFAPEVGRHDIQAATERIFHHFPGSRIDIDFSKIPESPESMPELQNGIIEAFGAGNLSDVFRFGMGKPGIKSAYNAVNDLAQAQVFLGNFASFTVIEMKLVKVAQLMERKLQKDIGDEQLKCIQILSRSKMRPEDLVDTVQVFFYNVPTSKVPRK